MYSNIIAIYIKYKFRVQVRDVTRLTVQPGIVTTVATARLLATAVTIASVGGSTQDLGVNTGLGTEGTTELFV